MHVRRLTRPSAIQASSWSGRFQEPQGIGDGDARFADAVGHLFLRKFKLLNELAISVGFLDGIQFFALQVFDQGQLKHLQVAHLAAPRPAPRPSPRAARRANAARLPGSDNGPRRRAARGAAAGCRFRGSKRPARRVPGDPGAGAAGRDCARAR